MTTTNAISGTAQEAQSSKRGRPHRGLDLFLGGQLARVLFEHDRNVILDRICEPTRFADQLFFGFAVEEWPLAQRAHENIKKFGVHAGISACPESKRRARDPLRP